MVQPYRLEAGQYSSASDFLQFDYCNLFLALSAYGQFPGSGLISFNHATHFGCQLLLIASLIFGRDTSLADDRWERAVVEQADPQLFSRFDSLVASQNWEQAAEAMALLVDQDHRGLLPVESNPTSNEIERFLPFRTVCQRRLARSFAGDPRLIEAYRKVVDFPASRALQLARSSNRIADYQAVLKKYALSSVGDEAFYECGARYLENGEYRNARSCWRALLPQPNNATENAPFEKVMVRFPDPRFDEPTVLAAIALSYILQKDFEQAKTKIERIRSLNPDATGVLAGRKGRYLDLLRDWIQANQTSPPIPNPPASANTHRPLDFPSVSSREIDPAGKPVWFVKHRTDDDANPIRLDIHPILVEGHLVWQDGNRIRAVRVDDGRPLFPFGDETDSSAINKGVIWEQTSPAVESDATSEASPAFTRMPCPLSGYGSQIFSIMPGVEKGRPHRIIGIDLSRGARLLPGFPIEPPEDKFEFVGFPQRDQSGLMVTLRERDSQTNRNRLWLAHYRLPATKPNGRLKPNWMTPMGDVTTANGRAWTDAAMPTFVVRAGTAYCQSQLGTLQAVDLSTGRVQWLIRYPRQEVRGSLLAGRYATTPSIPLMVGGNVIFAPMDSHRVISVDQTSGILNWSQTVVGVHHPLGRSNGLVVLDGQRTVWLDEKSGRVRGMARQQGPRTGHGFLAADAILTSRKNEIKFLRLPNPQTLPESESSYSFAEPMGLRDVNLLGRRVLGGNLLVSGQTLLIVNETGIFAYNSTGEPPRRPRTP